MLHELFDWFIREINPKEGEVIIWIDEWNMKSIMKVPCDEFWYPKFKHISTMSIQTRHFKCIISENEPIKNIEVLRKEIHIDSPMVVINEIRKVIVWKARLWGEDMETLENISIKTLQKMVTEAINRQDCIVLDNVTELIDSIKNLEDK